MVASTPVNAAVRGQLVLVWTLLTTLNVELVPVEKAGEKRSRPEGAEVKVAAAESRVVL